MRRLTLSGLLAVLVSGLVGAVLYLWYSAGLPDLSSKEAIRAGLAPIVESQRQVSMPWMRSEVMKLEVPSVSEIPPALVSMVLASESCPEALAAPKESGFAVSRRVLAHVGRGRAGDPGPGRCHWRFAVQIARAFGLVDALQSAIASAKILGALSAEDLLALRLATTFFGPGVVGYSQASRALFGRDPSRLDLQQTAELVVAEARYPEVSTCKNPLQLRKMRDDLLHRAESFGLFPAKEVAAAKARPLMCSLEP